MKTQQEIEDRIVEIISTVTVLAKDEAFVSSWISDLRQELRTLNWVLKQEYLLQSVGIKG